MVIQSHSLHWLLVYVFDCFDLELLFDNGGYLNLMGFFSLQSNDCEGPSVGKQLKDILCKTTKMQCRNWF